MIERDQEVKYAHEIDEDWAVRSHIVVHISDADKYDTEVENETHECHDCVDDQELSACLLKFWGSFPRSRKDKSVDFFKWDLLSGCNFLDTL